MILVMYHPGSDVIKLFGPAWVSDDVSHFLYWNLEYAMNTGWEVIGEL